LNHLLKKSGLVFLLFVFLLNTAGMFALFNYLKQEHHESVFSDKERKDLTWLTISRTEKVHWEKKNEIIYNGKYYDIFEKKEDEKNLYLLCYLDSKEEKMVKAFQRNIEDQQSSGANGKQSGSHSAKAPLHDFIPLSFFWTADIASVKIFNNVSSSRLTGFEIVFSPPPELG
jgi:hypothetical protein